MSVLLTICQMLAIPDEYRGFDVMIVSAINTAIFSLAQLGVDLCLVITGNEVWDDLCGDIEPQTIAGVKLYIYLYTRLVFDPPGTSFLITAMQASLDELATRLKIEMEEYES